MLYSTGLGQCCQTPAKQVAPNWAPLLAGRVRTWGKWRRNQQNKPNSGEAATRHTHILSQNQVVRPFTNYCG